MKMKTNPFIKTVLRRSCSALVLAMLGTLCVSNFATTAAGQELTIGSEAPPLDIEHWLSDRDGAFSKVTEFESGKVYVVEFWATWCGPCISTMPHLAKIQDDYADRDVQIISVTKEKLETVEKFLDREVKRRGDEDEDEDEDAEAMTYAQLTGQYCLTADPDRSVDQDYMKAAKQRGIPCAFIVGKSGLIEWLGHPSRMENVLESVVEDSWDRDGFAEKYAKEAKAKAKFGELMTKVKELSRGDDFEGAIEEIDTFIEELREGNTDKRTMFLQLGQLQMMKSSVALSAGGELAVEAMNSIADSKNPRAIVQFTSRALRQGMQDEELEEGMSKAVLKASENAIKLAKDERVRIMAFLSKAKVLFLEGKFDESIETTKQALEIREEQFLKKFIEKVEAAKEDAAKEDAAKEADTVTDTDTDTDTEGAKEAEADDEKK